eukprot:scaffold22815_cov60-Phaeocystis_antarctica.AAC.4
MRGATMVAPEKLLSPRATPCLRKATEAGGAPRVVNALLLPERLHASHSPHFASTRLICTRSHAIKTW